MLELQPCYLVKTLCMILVLTMWDSYQVVTFVHDLGVPLGSWLAACCVCSAWYHDRGKIASQGAQISLAGLAVIYTAWSAVAKSVQSWPIKSSLFVPFSSLASSRQRNRHYKLPTVVGYPKLTLYPPVCWNNYNTQSITISLLKYCFLWYVGWKSTPSVETPHPLKVSTPLPGVGITQTMHQDELGFIQTYYGIDICVGFALYVRLRGFR